jgi:hypothetical protein
MNQVENNQTVLAIEAAIAAKGPIAAEQVRRWMKDRDIEAQGAVANLITYPPPSDRIEPPLDEDDFERFLPNYYELCLRLDPVGEWADSRYGAAWQIADWFAAVPEEDDPTEYSFVVFLRDWLAETFENGKEEVQTAIIEGVLVRLFEEERWRAFFAGWKEDEELAEAYQEAARTAQG